MNTEKFQGSSRTVLTAMENVKMDTPLTSKFGSGFAILSFQQKLIMKCIRGAGAEGFYFFIHIIRLQICRNSHGSHTGATENWTPANSSAAESA